MIINRISNLPTSYRKLTERRNNKVKQHLIEFYHSDEHYGKIDVYLGEYSSMQSAYSSVYKAIRSMDLPLCVEIIQGDLYIWRTDYAK